MIDLAEFMDFLRPRTLTDRKNNNWKQTDHRCPITKELLLVVTEQKSKIWEGTFANILPGGDVCQFWAKIQPKTGKPPFRNKNTIICIKNT